MSAIEKEGQNTTAKTALMGSKSEEITAAKKNGSREWAPEDIEFEKNRQEIFLGYEKLDKVGAQ